MAGTDRQKKNAGLLYCQTLSPVVILDRPQLGENIGMSCRAMLNCGLSSLRLVAPRQGWDRQKATAAAAGAHEVLETAPIFQTLEEAICDQDVVYAFTARHRHMDKPFFSLKEAVRAIAADQEKGLRVAALFGRESTGLGNSQLAQSDVLVSIPLNPAFCSLNLSQAVLLFAYEWSSLSHKSLSHSETLKQSPVAGEDLPASKREMQILFEKLEAFLEARHFFHPVSKRPLMVRNLRSMLTKGKFTKKEIRMWHGVFAALVQKEDTDTL